MALTEETEPKTRVLLNFFSTGGAFALAAPAYTGEIAEPRIRGALGSLMQVSRR
jgi:hypothetical protein